MPPNVKRVVFEHGKRLDCQSIAYIQGYVIRILGDKATGTTVPSLETLVLHHTPFRGANLNEQELNDAARHANVSLALHIRESIYFGSFYNRLSVATGPTRRFTFNWWRRSNRS